MSTPNLTAPLEPAPPEAEPRPRQPLVEMDQIVKNFHSPAGDFLALKGVSVNFYPGEFVSIVGRSGSGKSTLANMITGIDHPTSGAVRINGTAIHQLKEGQMSSWRGRNLGIVFQFFQLMPILTLLENVKLPMDLCQRWPLNERTERSMHLLELVGLQDFANQLPDAVSGGQQQSAAIARALANDPPLLIADEPTGNLDSKTAQSVFAVFTQLIADGKTIIMVTHDQSLAEQTGRVIRISDGQLLDDTRKGGGA